MSATTVAVVVTLIVFLGADLLWVKFVTGPYFRARIGDMMLEDPKLGIALGFYVVFALGLVYFAVMPGLAAGSLWLVLGNAAFIGLLGYGTYEATNMAVMKNWTYGMMALDMTWGIFGSAGSAAAGYLAARAVS